VRWSRRYATRRSTDAGCWHAHATMALTTKRQHLWHVKKADFFMLATAFAATLIVGVEMGILIGFLLSMMLVIKTSALPHSAILGRYVPHMWSR